MGLYECQKTSCKYNNNKYNYSFLSYGYTKKQTNFYNFYYVFF